MLTISITTVFIACNLITIAGAAFMCAIFRH